jgi:hypothetical protein
MDQTLRAKGSAGSRRRRAIAPGDRAPDQRSGPGAGSILDSAADRLVRHRTGFRPPQGHAAGGMRSAAKQL